MCRGPDLCVQAPGDEQLHWLAQWLAWRKRAGAVEPLGIGMAHSIRHVSCLRSALILVIGCFACVYCYAPDLLPSPNLPLVTGPINTDLIAFTLSSPYLRCSPYNAKHC